MVTCFKVKSLLLNDLEVISKSIAVQQWTLNDKV